MNQELNALDVKALQNFIFDLDGVIWRGHTPIEGAVESVAQLRVMGRRCFYCTNNSSLSQEQFAARLRGIGIELSPEEVINSSWATARYLAREYGGAFTAFIVGEEGIASALREAGATIISEAEAENGALADCVVAGIDRSFTYPKLRAAQQQILKGARFVATNRDSTFPVENGVVPGAGSLVAAVATASGTEPFTVGKPAPLMLQLCVEQFGLNPSQTAMIGDRLDTDIACAHRAGLPAILVTTGVTSRLGGETATGEEKPDAIFDDLPALCRALA